MNRAAQGVMLKDCLKRLRLPAMLRDYPECSRQAKDEGDSYEGFLLNLASRELEQRQANQLKRRLKEARFPVMKTLEKTDLKKWPGLDAMKVRDYASCDYITSKDNLVFVGRQGTGKSHAATVFGVEACRQGHRVAFTTAAHLVNQLVEAREERQLQRYLNKLSRMGLLIVDELGYIPFSDTGAQLLFQVFADRYERASTLVTTNLPFAEWTRVFGDASLTAALLDRLTHRCHIHEFDWESIRLTESLQRQGKKRASQKSRSSEQADESS
jgi:DNA replication protein DnaC